MGGKNHQPCNQYLELSTRLSRNLSLANAQLELANVALEDVLLSELGGSIGSIDPILSQLGSSMESLGSALSDCATLNREMASRNFVDLPTLDQSNLEVIGKRFGQKKVVSPDHWQAVAQMMEDGGFREVLRVIAKHIGDLEYKTDILRKQIGLLRTDAEHGRIGAILEENRAGNIKVAFAHLYTAWQDFNHFFLASSLISTELWYLYTGRSSLLCEEGEGEIQAA